VIFSRVFGRLAFAFLLLFAQQQAVTHAISHLGAAPVERSASGPVDQSPPGDLQCRQCVAFASIAVALAGTPAAFVPPATIEALAVRAVQADHVPSIAHAFRSRAPPLIS
jgi:hypothetical protein